MTLSNMRKVDQIFIFSLWLFHYVSPFTDIKPKPKNDNFA